MLKHCHSRLLPPPTHLSNSLSSLSLSQTSSEVSFDSSYSAASPVPSSNMSSTGSLTSSDAPLSMSSDSTRVSLKVFASCLRPDIEYKTLCVSYQTKSKELIWQLLAKFRMKHRDPKLFYLTMDVVISKTGVPVTRTLVLDDEARPAELSSCNPWGECKFTLQMRKGGLVRIYDKVLMEESNYKSLLISEETTVEDVVRILLHCYGFERFAPRKFSIYEHCRTQSYERKLNYEDRPLAVQDSWLDPTQFRLVLRRAPVMEQQPRRGSFHQLGLPNVPVHSHATTDMGARAVQASLIKNYSKFCQKYESYFYV